MSSYNSPKLCKMEPPIGTLPGDFIRSMYHGICQENQIIHDTLLENIVNEALSEDAMRAYYTKAVVEFKTKPMTGIYLNVIYFPLEALVQKAKEMAVEGGKRFYLLDEKRHVLDFGDTTHFPVNGRDHPCSGGPRALMRDRWEAFYAKHPIINRAAEKIIALFPGWVINQTHMRWYEKSGYPYICCLLECTL